MVNLLSKIFIKNYERTDEPKVRRSYGILCSFIGIGLNIILFVIKWFAGIISGSIAITADAFNNLSDAGSSLITLVGFKFSGKKPDPEHPFGHGRIEYISGLAVAVIIIVMGFELAKSSLTKILHPTTVSTSILSVFILIISICIKIYMAFYNTRIGKKISSPAMKATAADSLSDSVATTVVLISMLILKITNVNVDGIGGMLVAIFILYAGYNAAKDTLSPLLGSAPDMELVNKIEEIVLSHEEIIGIHDLIVHDYGPGRFMISLHGEVPGNEDVYAMHDAIDRIENELEDKLNCEAVIHMDPIAVDNENVSILKKRVIGLINSIDEGIKIHDFRIVTGPTHTNLIFDAVIPFKFKLSDDEVRTKIENLVTSNLENCYAVIKIDKDYSGVQH